MLKGWIEIRTCVTDGDVIIPSEASVLQSLNLQPKTSSISFYYMIHNFFGGGIFIFRNVQVPQAGILWMSSVVRSHSTSGILYRHVLFHFKMSFFTSYLFVLIEYMKHSFECHKRNVYSQTIVMREKYLSTWFGFDSARSSWMLCWRFTKKLMANVNLSLWTLFCMFSYLLQTCWV